MSEYLIFISAVNQRELTPAQEEECLSEYGSWSERLGSSHVLARRLEASEGKLLRSKKHPTTDGPFVEAKELIAGIILINAKSEHEANALMQTCPLNQYFHLFMKKVNK